MPTLAVVAVVAIVIVLAAYAVTWFRDEAWPLAVLAVIVVISTLTFLFNHAPAALVLGLITLGGLIAAIVYIIWCVKRMIEEEGEP